MNRPSVTCYLFLVIIISLPAYAGDSETHAKRITRPAASAESGNRITRDPVREVGFYGTLQWRLEKGREYLVVKRKGTCEYEYYLSADGEVQKQLQQLGGKDVEIQGTRSEDGKEIKVTKVRELFDA